MKQLYTFILLIFAAYSVKAQYTLTSAANPVIGDIEKTWQADTLTPTGLYPAGGTSQIWNYSGIIISPTTAAVSSSFVAVSAAPNASLFSAANIAKTSDGMNYELSNYGATSITNYGTSNSSVSIVYQNPQLIANLPFTYGTLCNDTYSASYTQNSIPASRTGTVSTQGDGTGTLNMPGNKNYPNTLRIKLLLTQIDNFGSVGSQTITVKAYVYVNSVSKYSLLAINVATIAAVSGTTSVTFYSKTVNVGDMLFAGVKENSKATDFSIYPNPAAGKEITLQFTPNTIESYEVNIFNALGQNVKHLNLNKTNGSEYKETINVSELSSGLYYIKLRGNGYEGTQKLLID
ncbi:MAG: T9SS type A sorting domain-containing protein [Bacteroidetes bacterium]|nr:T9SS type A sorting domain-containing protein [Bacteroidota bacterium]